MEKIKKRLLLMLQHLWLTFEFFGKNGLENHASASAYGFLLSAAPVILVISFLVSIILYRSPDLVAYMSEQIGSLSELFNAGDFFKDFLDTANPKLAGFISVIPIFWAARLCALSIQRGLGIIFPERKTDPKKAGPFRATAVTLALGFLIIIFIFIMLLGSRLTLDFFNSMDFDLAKSLLSILLVLPARTLPIAGLFLLILLTYRFVPVNHPEWKHVIPGALTCIIIYIFFNMGFSFLMDPDRYNLLYGTLGNLFLFLLNVYFFFYFYLFGAQFVMVQASSDALLFVRFKQHHNRPLTGISLLGKNLVMPWDKLFASPPWPLLKYVEEHKEGELVIVRGSLCQEVYYILTGKAGVYLDEKCQNRIALIEEKHFFGEMEFVVSEGRSASIKAETDLSVIRLSRELYHNILQIDPETDRSIIQGLSERLKSSNQREENDPRITRINADEDMR